MNPFHYLFDRLFPLIRFTYERLLRHRWFDEITPQLWLGGAPLYVRDYDFLQDAGISAVVNLRAERHDDFELYQRQGIAYLQLKVLDIMIPPIDILDEGVAFIHSHVEQNGVVLVHCAKGRGRSATLLAAYLMRHQNLSFVQARALLTGKRPLTRLDNRHKRHLEQWIRHYRPAETAVAQHPIPAESQARP